MNKNKVVCINDNFPRLQKYGGSERDAPNKPKLGEVLTIDEILGDFFRFDKYDCEDSFNWWYAKNFAPINEEEIENEINELLQVPKQLYL